MKIYNKKEFLKLPPGTFFAKGVRYSMDGFCVKGETWENDFLYIDLVSIDSYGSDNLLDRFEEMIEKSISYPINETYSRDGMFDEEDIFLVFEKEDLKIIRNLINKLLGEM